MKNALSEGDENGLVNAVSAITKASALVSQIEKMAAVDVDEPRQLSPQATRANQQSQDLRNDIVRDWLEDHPELDALSPNHNPEIANYIGDFIEHLDKQLVSTGRANMHFTEPYFARIEHEFTRIKQQGKSKEAKVPESAHYVAGVKNNSSGTLNNVKAPVSRVTLTASEKDMCKDLGVTEKDWLKFKLQGPPPKFRT